MSITLALIVFIGLVFSALALIDIAQNKEPDLSLEWMVVRVSYLFTVIYVAISSVTIIKLRKKDR